MYRNVTVPLFMARACSYWRMVTKKEGGGGVDVDAWHSDGEVLCKEWSEWRFCGWMDGLWLTANREGTIQTNQTILEDTLN